jgi:hypothetical protein
MFEDGFTGVEGLGASGLLGQTVKAAFGIGVESDGEPGANLLSLYTYSKSAIALAFFFFSCLISC